MLEPSNEEIIMMIPVSDIRSSEMAKKPYRNQEVINSVREKGVLKTIVVRKIGDTYYIIDGYQRVKACRELGITHIDAQIIN